MLNLNCRGREPLPLDRQSLDHLLSIIIALCIAFGLHPSITDLVPLFGTLELKFDVLVLISDIIDNILYTSPDQHT